MDLIGQKFAGQIDKMVADCLTSFPNLSEEQKTETSDKIRDHLNQVILDTLVDNANEAQISQLESLDPESPEMEAKITEVASQIPNLAFKIDAALEQACQDYLKNTFTQPNQFGSLT